MVEKWRPKVRWEKVREEFLGENPDDWDSDFFEAGADALLQVLISEGRYYRLHRVSRPLRYKQPKRAPGWVVFIPEKSREKERE